MFDCLRGKRGCYCWASGPQLVPPNVRACTRPPCKHLKFSLSVLIRWGWGGGGRSSLSFDGNCYVLRHLWVFLGRLLKDLFNSSCCFYLGCCRLPQQKRRSKIHPRLQDFFIPGWFVHYSLKTTRGIFWHTVNPFLLFFSHDSVC